MGEPLGRSSSSPPTETHQLQTLGKRSYTQLYPSVTKSCRRERPRPRQEEKEADDGAYAPASCRVSTSRGINVQGSGWRASRLKVRMCTSGATISRRTQRAPTRTQSKDVYIGCYDIEEDAARAHRDYVEHGTLPARKVVTSAFRGVSWRKSGKVWRAEFRKSGQHTHLGMFQTQQEEL